MVISVFLSVCVCRCKESVSEIYLPLCTGRREGVVPTFNISKASDIHYSLTVSSACNTSSARPTNSEIRETEAGCARLLPSL